MAAERPPLRAGIIGMGGFAGWHHATVARLEALGQVRLVCTCDPELPAFAAARAAWQLEPRGVKVFSDHRAMLEACRSELDFVVIPTPIGLHAGMHADVVGCGLAAYVEKPPTLDPAELERMIAADGRAPRPAAVGFNFIVDPARLALKDRLAAGEFGAILGASFFGLWPRPADYFTRNRWAGRLIQDGQFVLDSCFGNASSHFVHNLFFWLGAPGRLSWAPVAAVRAELYRAHAIEGADTFFVEAATRRAGEDARRGVAAGGPVIRFAISHACAGANAHAETVRCEKAVLTTVVGERHEVRWSDGRVERFPAAGFELLDENHLEYYRFLRGEAPRPLTTLPDCRPFVAADALAYISSGRIAPILAEFTALVRGEKDQKEYIDVASLASMAEDFASGGPWPSARGWRGEPGAPVTPADLPRLPEAVRAMAEAAFPT